MKEKKSVIDHLSNGIVLSLCMLFVIPFQMLADVKSENFTPRNLPDSTTIDNNNPLLDRQEVKVPDQDGDGFVVWEKDSVGLNQLDSVPIAAVPGGEIMALESYPTDSLSNDGGKYMDFNPNPNRAVWLSALFPGLGQVYNRRYWKLPIVAGGFLGISYALGWNNRMLGDYTKAYRDAMDNDPSTKSYMDFFPSNTTEADLDPVWLKKTLKARKDFYRRNRDLSIICMVGMYLLCMVDAYVDASLSHFDISPDLSMNVYPALLDANQNGKPSVGIQWAINF